VSPTKLVLEREQLVDLVVTGLPGSGAVRTAVNVGEVAGIEAKDDQVRVHYRSPPELVPQRLCLLLWRKGSTRAVVVNVPLWAYADVSVKTRPRSQVTVEVAGKTFGPQPSGRRGKVSIRALVPPGVTGGWAEAVDAVGLRNRKPVKIEPVPYNLLALGVESEGGAHRLTLAASEDPPAAPAVDVHHSEDEGGSAETLTLRRIGKRRWSASWRPAKGTRPGVWVIRAGVPGSALSERRVEVTVAAPKVVRPLEPKKPITPVAHRRLKWNVSLATGVMHNTMALVSARFTFEGGGDYPLGPGRVGLRLVAGVAWASQDVPVAPGISDVSSTVVMVPLGAVATYRLSYGRWGPYAAVGPLVQLVRSSSEGEHSGTRRSLSAAAGFLGLLGARMRLGPGGVFLQAGYQHSSVDSRDTELLAGGIVFELGYRLEL
jgi:hypothetical protein